MSHATEAPTPRRQWGAERRSEPMSIVHPRPSVSTLTWGRVAITVTVLSWLGYFVSTIVREFLDAPDTSFRFTMEALSYLLVVTGLTFSALMYLVARQGALQRFRDHERVPRGLIDRHFGQDDEALTVLVPSYAEEPDVVRLTLWSAALQEHPDLRVVLLIDDPPHPSDPAVIDRLATTRALAGQIEDALQAPSARALATLERARQLAPDQPAGRGPMETLAAEYAAAAGWLEAMAEVEDVRDHVAEFFTDQVLMGLASELRLTLLAVEAALDQGASLPGQRVVELHRRLAWIFGARLSSFERKQFSSLSQEANKAMNINAYLGLMGRTWRPEETVEGTVLEPVGADEQVRDGDLVVEDTGYVLTLDADSQLLRDYCIRLVHHLEQPENERVAIVQTPYSSFRGAPTRIERIAGATTDVQHILHQGMTHYGATFWVGANAVIRKRALEDIVEVQTVGGREIRTYIQDRTVIEDTESSIDIGTQGWQLHNYPERLSYSATPPDYGSLVVQRRRWANGGLLILPRFLAQLRVRRLAGRRVGLGELCLRMNYMASIAWSTFGLAFLLFYPYDSRLLSPLVLGAALPYFIAMGSDLRACGHRFLDIFRIYGFNLVLLPVNLAGTLKSIQQMFTGQKIPFARTPKVRNRTAAPALHVLVPYLVVGFSIFTAYRNFNLGNWGNFAFAVFNAVLALGAIRAYIGLRASLVDIGLGVVNWLYVERRPTPAPEAEPVRNADGPVAWEAILFHGDRRLARDLRRREDRRRRLRPSGRR